MMKTNGQKRIYTAVVEYDQESRMFVANVPGLQGAHTQAATLDELQANLKEVVELCVEEFGPGDDERPVLIGLQQIEIEYDATSSR